MTEPRENLAVSSRELVESAIKNSRTDKHSSWESLARRSRQTADSTNCNARDPGRDSSEVTVESSDVDDAS